MKVSGKTEDLRHQKIHKNQKNDLRRKAGLPPEREGRIFRRENEDKVTTFPSHTLTKLLGVMEGCTESLEAIPSSRCADELEDLKDKSFAKMEDIEYGYNVLIALDPEAEKEYRDHICLLYTSPSPRDS